MNIFFENKKRIVAIVIVLLALGAIPFAYFVFNPEFPDDVSSLGRTDTEALILQEQTELFDRFTRYLRLNHGGILDTETIDEHQAPSGKSESFQASYKQQYRFINDELLIQLIRRFGQAEEIPYKIKKYTYNNKELQKPDSYEVIFYKDDNPWVSIKLEWADETIYKQRQQIQYTEITEQSSIDQEVAEPVAPSKGKAKLAIIIDDLGNNMDVFSDLIQLDFEITYAVLPQLPLSRETAEIVHSAGHDVMLHQPMQPKEWPKLNPGIGALLVSDSEETIHQKMEANFRSVPYIVGVNNHMGSAYTQFPEGLTILMKILSDRNLFFVDSKTAPGRMARTIATENNVRYLSRNIFLDNEQEEGYVQGQLYKAVRIAQTYGRAIAIGHPYHVTHLVLSEHLPRLKDDGIEIVRISELLRD